MSFRLTFIERKDPESASVERVFQRIGKALQERDVDVRFEKLRYGNNAYGMLKNALFYRAGNSDIFHITGQVHYMALLLPRDRTVLTIHDLVVLRARRGLRRLLIQKLLFDLPARRAKYLTVSSENTKNELLKFTKCSEEKIRVLDLPLPRELKGSPKSFNSHRPVILQVGTAHHKNISTLARALKGVKCTLRVIGKLAPKDLDALLTNEIDFTSCEDLSDDQMTQEYSYADIVVFCSIYEGFGLPILEAQAMCVPLVTSNSSPMRETAGEGAILVDPGSPKEIRDAILTIINSSELRGDLIRKGQENIKRFSIERISDELLGLYEEVRSEWSSALHRAAPDLRSHQTNGRK
jgi:glycosyltransferase involved in cell wall biosynthesis